MRPDAFLPGFALARVYKENSEELIVNFMQFLAQEFESKFEERKKKFDNDMKSLIAEYIFLNFSFVSGDKNRSDTDWEFSCSFKSSHFISSDMFNRHVIYNVYAHFLMKDARYPRAAGGSYDTSFLSMLIIMMGNEGIRECADIFFNPRQLSDNSRDWIGMNSREDLSWAHAWIIKMCRRKMEGFLPGNLYTKRPDVPVRTLIPREI